MGPVQPAWGVLKLEPWRLRVFPGEFARSGGEILIWQDGDGA